MYNSALQSPHNVCFASGVNCHQYSQSGFFRTKVFRRKLGSTARWAGRSAWYEHPTLDATKSSAWHAVTARNAERLIRPVWSRVQIPPGPPIPDKFSRYTFFANRGFSLDGWGMLTRLQGNHGLMDPFCCANFYTRQLRFCWLPQVLLSIKFKDCSNRATVNTKVLT